MSDRLDEFVIEAREHLAVVEDSLLALEKRPDSQDRIDRCFRSIHSIKGDAGFLGLQPIHELAHAMESLLDQTNPPAASSTIETLLVARDRLAVLVDDPHRAQAVDLSEILQRLNSAASETTSFEIDLSEQTGTQPGGLLSFLRQFLAQGRISEGAIQIAPCDLRKGVPRGPVIWTGLIQTNTGSKDHSSPAEIPIGSKRVHTEKLLADLSVWSRTESNLVSRFRDLVDVACVTAGAISFPSVDLRIAIPIGPVLWSGECETRLSRAELVHRFGFLGEQNGAQAVVPSRPSMVDPKPTPAVTTVAPHRRQAPAVVAPTATANSVPPVENEKSTTLRIQVELLDRMMTLVGELTLVRNQSLLAFAEEDGSRRAIIQRLNSVTSELQDVTLRARMQPVGNLFNKFPRMVRDLARQLGKQVELDLQGREVELDKTILEQLSDPLMHLIRNSVDHGLEMPDERRASGKSEIGRIVLSAAHEDGQVHIQIRDDGRGIDSEAVKAKALSLGLKNAADLDRMSPRELFSLILLPGFSTAKKVTEVSGRGVGMDVVKTNIDQLEGTLTIDSAVGHGCSIALRLPLTLAIIPCLIVAVDGENFAVPQRDLEEVVSLHPGSSERIEQAFNTEVYRLRDRLLPIVRFTEVLKRKEPFTVEAKAEIMTAHADDHALARIEYILVLRLAGRRFGLVVDQVKGTQEIVVKPMHPSMKRVGIFNGATIMGDGRVALIADIQGIVEHAKLSFESALDLPAKTASVRDAAQAHRVLLFEYGPDERFALPLIQIRRIEMVSQGDIERVGGHEYITIDGVSTRILRLNKVINVSAPEADSPQMSLILPKFVQQPIGILVSRIVDTESLALDLQHHPDDETGILGSAIVRDRLTLFLEMHHLSNQLLGITSVEITPVHSHSQRTKKLLLVDDTAFFREVVKRYLAAEGHEVVTAIHGQDGLSQLSREHDFDLIVSDIEMPVMDGWEFAREVRRRGIQTPMLALTSLSGIEYEVKAQDCGYDSYEVKLDHDRLVRKVGNLLAAQEVSR